MSFRSATLLALVGLPPLLCADECPPAPKPPRNETVVTADRRPTPIDRTTASVATVTAQEDAERGHSPTALDRLIQIPGLTAIKGNGGIDGGVGFVAIRGSTTAYTQFLVDGLPVSDATAIQGDRNPALIDPAGLDRVEVVKGTQSGLYGSRAIGGVINYLTDRPTAVPEASVQGQVGSFGTYAGDLRATGPIGRQAGYAAAVQVSTTRGFSSTTGAGPGLGNSHPLGGAVLSDDGNGQADERDGAQKAAARLRLEYRLRPAVALYSSVSGSAANADLDSLGDPQDPEGFKQDRAGRMAIGGTFGDQQAPIEGSVDTAYSWDSRLYRFPGVNDETYRSDEWYGQGRLTGHPVADLALTAGADVKRQYADFQGFSEFHKADSNLGLWGQAAWSTPWTELSLTGRSDIPSAAQQSQTTGRIGAVVVPVQEVRFRAAAATGFRAPSLYERYVDSQAYDFGGIFYRQQGNSALRAETTRQGEVGFDLLPLPGCTLAATAFRTLYDRRIDSVTDYDAATNTLIGTYVNAEAYSRSDGFETSVELDQPAGWPCTTRVWYTLTRTEDDQGREFIRVPRHSGGTSVTLRQASGRWQCWETASLERQTGYYVRDFQLGDLRTRDRSLVNVAVGAAYKNTYEVSLRCENLLNDTDSPTPTSSGNFTATPLSYLATVGVRF